MFSSQNVIKTSKKSKERTGGEQNRERDEERYVRGQGRVKKKIERSKKKRWTTERTVSEGGRRGAGKKRGGPRDGRSQRGMKIRRKPSQYGS